MTTWLLAHWKDAITAAAFIFSGISLRASLHKPVADRQIKLRENLDKYLHQIDLIVKDTRGHLREVATVRENIQRLQQYDKEMLRNLQRKITAPRPKLIEGIRIQIRQINLPDSLYDSLRLAEKLDLLRIAVDQLLTITSDIDNSVPFAKFKHRKRLRFVKNIHWKAHRRLPVSLRVE